MANLYVDDVLVRSTTQIMGYVNYESDENVYIRVTGLGSPFNQSQYTKWGISNGPLDEDGTTVPPRTHCLRASRSFIGGSQEF